MTWMIPERRYKDGRIKSVPGDAEELTTGVPQSPGGLLAPALGSHEGRCTVTETSGHLDEKVKTLWDKS